MTETNTSRNNMEQLNNLENEVDNNSVNLITPSSSIHVLDSPGSLVLDLTADELDFINDTNVGGRHTAAAPGSSIDNSISLDDDTFAFFVEAGLDDPEELAMLGIDIEEIRNQRSIAERLEQQNRRDHEAAMELQRQIERERYIPPSVAQLAQPSDNTLSNLQRNSSFMSQSSIKREIDNIDTQFNKRPKIETNDKGKQSIQLIDDDDFIDLTDDSIGSFSAAVRRGMCNRGYDVIDQFDTYSSTEENEEDYLSNIPWNQGSHNGMTPPPYGGSGKRTGLGTRKQADFPLFGGDGFGFHHYAAHIESIARLERGQRALPNIATYNVPALSAEETEKELRDLLEHVVYDEPPAPEDRTGTPNGLSIFLLEHQKIGLQWMIKMENSKNKGGILADDMGLGKVSLQI